MPPVEGPQYFEENHAHVTLCVTFFQLGQRLFLSSELLERSELTYTAGMKIAVTIPDEVFRRAEEIANALGISRSELYAKALAEFIREQRDERITERLNQAYAENNSSLDATLEQLQAASLPVERW